ncbi:hypothetical protein K491DRAFT_715430 [Lophiostoma macrostomum CBS 122681]|uniref:Uncharacterized protein n=1 Tax=Lophiostoma macrostomum CBS 122681 TaxID=1314788 RepID=A0A6A6TCL7_9PLEO|nr:hypothetical protein K491DRAFT_715430 [Lophiostoma macrostomum CBS 122681]
MPLKRRNSTTCGEPVSADLVQKRRSSRIASSRAVPIAESARTQSPKHFIVAPDLGTTRHVTAYKRVDLEDAPTKFITNYPHNPEALNHADQVPSESWYAVKSKDRKYRKHDRGLTKPQFADGSDVHEMSDFQQRLYTDKAIPPPYPFNDAIHEGYLTGKQVENQLIDPDDRFEYEDKRRFGKAKLMLDQSKHTEGFRKTTMEQARLLKTEDINKSELDVYYDQLTVFLRMLDASCTRQRTCKWVTEV